MTTITKRLTLPFITNETIQSKVTVREAGRDIDPTALTVQFAAVAVSAEPEEADWVNGSWETAGRVYHAQVDVSGTGLGGDLALARGSYDVWLRLEQATTTPARLVGRLVIT
jgi:hypothetical protein